MRWLTHITLEIFENIIYIQTSSNGTSQDSHVLEVIKFKAPACGAFLGLYMCQSFAEKVFLGQTGSGSQKTEMQLKAPRVWTEFEKILALQKLFKSVHSSQERPTGILLLYGCCNISDKLRQATCKISKNPQLQNILPYCLRLQKNHTRTGARPDSERTALAGVQPNQRRRL